MVGTFTKKRIIVEVFLKAKKFEDGNDSIKIDGLPTSVVINKGGIPSQNEASIIVEGLGMEKMRSLVVVGFAPLQLNRNRVKIYAGDTETPPLVFVGDQTEGVISIDDNGNARLSIKAFTSVFAAQNPTPPVAVNGTAQAAELCSQFAKEAGFSFENQGVTSSLSNCVISGDPVNKMINVSRQIGANLIIDDQTVTLLPKDKPRKGPTDIISPETGLIGYPNVTARGVSCRCLFMPQLRFGQSVKVESVIPMASGTHRIIKINHTIEANKPDGGAWFTTFDSYFNYGL